MHSTFCVHLILRTHLPHALLYLITITIDYNGLYYPSSLTRTGIPCLLIAFALLHAKVGCSSECRACAMPVLCSACAVQCLCCSELVLFRACAVQSMCSSEPVQFRACAVPVPVQCLCCTVPVLYSACAVQCLCFAVPVQCL